MNTLPILEQAARAAGDVVLSYFHKESHIIQKTSHQNLVTQADTASQTLIRKIISEQLIQQGIAENEIGFIGEEKLYIKGKKHTFIIDPLDGTNNFASGLDIFCVSIAHVEDGKLTHAAIYWPSRDAFYTAQAGSGAFKKIKGQSPIPLRVTEELLENSVIFSYIPSEIIARKHYFSTIEKVFSAVRGVRIQGSVCLDLAHLSDSENSAHVVMVFHTWLWDLAAGYLIVKESGGSFMDFSGRELEVDLLNPEKQYSFIAAHNNTSTLLLPYIQDSAQK